MLCSKASIQGSVCGETNTFPLNIHKMRQRCWRGGDMQSKTGSVCATHVLCVIQSGRLNTVCANNDSVAVPKLRGVSLYVCVCLCSTVLSPLKAVKELLAK